MVVSSRTPEGSPNRCPVCGAEVRLDPSGPLGDAPCPACGHLLWFVAVGPAVHLFDPDAVGLVDLLADRLGVRPADLRAGRWADLGIDSLDLVELVMELEEQLG